MNLARPFIFTTGLPAAACAAALSALKIVRDEPWRRERALTLASRLRDRLTQPAGTPPTRRPRSSP